MYLTRLIGGTAIAAIISLVLTQEFNLSERAGLLVLCCGVFLVCIAALLQWPALSRHGRKSDDHADSGFWAWSSGGDSGDGWSLFGGDGGCDGGGDGGGD